MRRVLSLFVASVLVLSLVACGGKQTESQSAAKDTVKAYELNLGHTGAPNHHYQYMLTKFAEDVKAKSGGRLVITVFPSDQLGNQMESTEGTMLGTQDMVLNSDMVLSNWVKEMGILNLPFLFKDNAHLRKVELGISSEKQDAHAGRVALHIDRTRVAQELRAAERLASRTAANAILAILLDDLLIEILKSSPRYTLILKAGLSTARAGTFGDIGCETHVGATGTNIDLAPLQTHLIRRRSYNDGRDLPFGNLLIVPVRDLALGKTWLAEGQGACQHRLQIIANTGVQMAMFVHPHDDGPPGAVGKGDH